MVESTNQNVNEKQECDIVMLGHVDVGKSTLCGRILLDLGMVDQRDVDKLQQEAHRNGMSSWWLAYLMDQDINERKTGKTTHVSRTQFQTANRKYNLTDCGGHQKYTSLMTNSVLQSNFAVMLVSALKNEYLTSVSLTNNSTEQNEGSLRQHFKLLKNSNCSKVIVAINKMDHTQIQWSEQIFNQRVQDVKTFVQRLYRIPETVVEEYLTFVPISAFSGENVVLSQRKEQLYSWYQGSSLIETLDSFISPYNLLSLLHSTEISNEETSQQPLRVSMITTFPNDNQNAYIVKVESGVLTVNDRVFIYPNDKATKVKAIRDSELNEIDQDKAFPGQKVCIELLNIVLDDSQCQGVIISKPENKPCVSNTLEVELSTFQLPYGVILSSGSELIMHIHSLTIPCSLKLIKENYNHENQQVPNRYINSMQRSKCILAFQRNIAFENSNHSLAKQFSQFALRIGHITVAVGKVLRHKQ